MRISRDIGLEKVSEATGISISVLRSLEDENRERLPAEVYTRAFYKKYAQYLGLDIEEVLSKYQQEANRLKKTRRRFNFRTVITLKDQDDNLFADIARQIFVPIIIIALGILCYWAYKNYLGPVNPLGFFQESLPTFCSASPAVFPVFAS